MRGTIPKVLRVVLVNLAHDRPGGPRFVSRRWRIQYLDDLLLPLVPVGDVGFDTIRTIFYDGSMAGVKLNVLGHSFCKGVVVIVHFLETSHVLSKILEDGGSIAEDGVCRKEGTVKWEVDSDRVGGVARGAEEVEGSEIGVRGIILAHGHR